MILNKLPKRKKRKMPKPRIGRGYGSNRGGHTVGRGQKGQKSRSGHKSMVFFEGGNVPLYKRLPKYRGFNRPQKVTATPINVSVLDEFFKNGDKVTLETLQKKNLVKKNSERVKILGEGDLEKKLTVEGLDTSKGAKEKIEKAGGEVK